MSRPFSINDVTVDPTMCPTRRLAQVMSQCTDAAPHRFFMAADVAKQVLLQARRPGDDSEDTKRVRSLMRSASRIWRLEMGRPGGVFFVRGEGMRGCVDEHDAEINYEQPHNRRGIAWARSARAIHGSIDVRKLTGAAAKRHRETARLIDSMGDEESLKTRLLSPPAEKFEAPDSKPAATPPVPTRRRRRRAT